MERQALNVFRMRLLGAEVRPVNAGTRTLKDATSEAIRDWVTNVETTHYILGSVAGPHPYPMMVGPLAVHQTSIALHHGGVGLWLGGLCQCDVAEDGVHGCACIWERIAE